MTNDLHIMKEKAEALKKERNVKRVKLFNWLRTFDYKNNHPFSYSYDEIAGADSYNLYLPRIDKMIIGFGENYIHAFDDLVEQANALMDKYLRKHPALKIKHFYDAEEHKVNFGPGYAPYITWNGEFLAKPFIGAVTKNDLFKEVVKKYKSLEDDDFGFFFQAMSNTVFSSENTVEENMQNLTNSFKEKYGHSMERVNVYYEDGLYMVIGKLIYKEDYSK